MAEERKRATHSEACREARVSFIPLAIETLGGWSQELQRLLKHISSLQALRLSVVGKVFCKILNNRLVQCLDKEGALHEGQAGFRINRSCMDNVYTLNEIVQGRLREDKKTYAFFLDIQKAYDSVWHDGLWYKLWDMGVKGRMWRVIKKMYESSKSAVLLEGEKSDTFTIEQGVAQGCSLSPILFSVFVNDLLKEVEQTGLGIQLSSGKTVGGMLFADDFVGISDSKESLQKLLALGTYPQAK